MLQYELTKVEPGTYKLTALYEPVPGEPLVKAEFWLGWYDLNKLNRQAVSLFNSDALWAQENFDESNQ